MDFVTISLIPKVLMWTLVQMELVPIGMYRLNDVSCTDLYLAYDKTVMIIDTTEQPVKNHQNLSRIWPNSVFLEDKFFFEKFK